MKKLLEQYSAALSRIKLLRQEVFNKERQIEKMNAKGYYVSDVVSCGRKGKKHLGTVRVSGFPYEKYSQIKKQLEKQKDRLMEEEQELLELVTKVEEYISAIKDIEMRSILTLYYVEDMNWVQVANRMNNFSKRNKYTEGSCRLKHDRFLEKI